MTKSAKNIVVVFLIGCLIYIIGQLISGNYFRYENSNEFFVDFSFFQLYTFVLSYINTWYFGLMRKRQFTSYEVIQRIIYGIIGATVLTLIAIFFLRLFISNGLYGQSFKDFIDKDSWQGYAFGLWITLSIVSVFYISYFYNRYQRTK